MSLQVWLPLNGTLENLGLSDVTVTNNGATVNTSGKIGSCYTGTSTSQTIVATLPGLSDMLANGKCYSLACWVKVIGTATSGWCVKLGTNNCGLWWAKSEARWVWNENDNGKRCANPTVSGDTENWYHLVNIVDKTDPSAVVVRHYVNGAPAEGYDSHTIDMSSLTQPAGDIITITPYIANVNDLRIYDHCLSQKEVKELSKGLVGHWPLNDYHSVGPINKYSSPYSDGELSTSSWTKTKLTDERGWNYKLTRTGTGTNVYPYGNVPNYSFTVGKTYYYSVKVRCHKWSVGALALRAARCNNDWATRSINVCEPSKADGKWHEYYTYQTIPESFDRSGTTVTSNPVFEFYSSAQGTEGTVYDMDFDVKDIQVLESDEYLPFIDNSIADTTIYDCSGYGRNGSVSPNPPTVDSDTPRYSVCNKFNGSNNFIALGRGAMVRDEITVNAWAYMSDWSTYTGRIISCTEGGGWNFEPASGKLSFQIGTGESSNTYKGVTSSTAILTTLSAGWHMFTGTYDGLASKVYVDAVLQKAYSAYTTKTPIFYHTSNGIFIGAEAANNQTTPSGNYFNGKLSDVRIYATALSAADIKELYETAASVDKNGNFWGYELSET